MNSWGVVSSFPFLVGHILQIKHFPLDTMPRRDTNNAEEVKIVELDLDLFHLMWVIMKVFLASLPAFIGAVIVYSMIVNLVLSSIGS